MDDARASAGEARRNVAALTERVQSLQSELDQSELRREELEAELTNTQEVRSRCVLLLVHVQVVQFKKKKKNVCVRSVSAAGCYFFLFLVV